MRYYLAIFITIVLFSTVEVVTKHIGKIDQLLLAFLRFFPPGAAILAIGARGLRQVRAADFLFMAMLGVIAVTLTFYLYHSSLRTLDASVGAVIFSINPVFATLTALVLLRERFGLMSFAGVLLGLVGVYIVSFGFRTATLSTAAEPAMMFGAQVCFGVYVGAAKKYVAKYGPFLVNGIIFVIGSLLCLPLVRDWTIPAANFAPWWIAYLSVVATGIAYILYFIGLNRVPVVAGTSVFYLKPVLAPLLAAHVQSDRLRTNFFVGLLVILAALTVTIYGANRRQPPPAQT